MRHAGNRTRPSLCKATMINQIIYSVGKKSLLSWPKLFNDKPDSAMETTFALGKIKGSIYNISHQADNHSLLIIRGQMNVN